jgi:hypothetical protein
MKYGFIYKITNLINNKKYIGFKVYTKGWEEYMGSSKPLKEDIKKYGKENFQREILDEGESLKDLQEKEINYLTKNNVLQRDDYYNQSIPHPSFRILKGGSHCNKGKTWEEVYGVEYANKKREALRNRIKGKTWEEICGNKEKAKQRRIIAKQSKTEVTKRKMSEGRKGMRFTDTHRANLSKARKKYLNEQKTHSKV